MLPCLNKKFLGVDCMGCGIQRAFFFLLKGDFIAAFYIYPAIYPLLLLLGYLLINQFDSLKHANYVIPFLSIFTVLTIIISYSIKITHH